MRTKSTVVTAALCVLSAIATPKMVYGLDLSFLDQAPIRFFNETDLKLMSASADKALDEGKDGKPVPWSNDQTGNSGVMTPTRSFTRDGTECRQLEIVSLAREATRGNATSRVDFCKVGGTWKILAVAP